MKRRPALLALAGALASSSVWAQAPKTAVKPALEVWKDPNCGCCQLWVEHLQAHGFEVKVHDVGNTAVRKRLGVPERLGSCHTASVAGYVIEGHVPAADILRLLRQKPQALGLAVPGMPIGSPGMDGEVYKGRRDAYEVLLVQRDGSTRTFTKYPGAPVQQRVSAQSASDNTVLPWTVAEVRRVDASARKVSLRHEEIKNLDMPPMTMVFQVREGVSLDGLRVGQRIRFQAVQDKGAYWMVAWQAASV
jgi:hypothetical protein